MKLHHKIRLVVISTVLVLGCSLSLNGSATVLNEPNISVRMAQQVARTALRQCRRDGFRVSVTVVDRAGLVKATLRDDGTGPHTLGSSFRKAYTAVSLRRSTAELAKLVVDVPTVEGLRDMDENILLLAGGLPITFNGGEVIGGVGVGGAPGGQFDESCAQAGIDRIQNNN